MEDHDPSVHRDADDDGGVNVRAGVPVRLHEQRHVQPLPRAYNWDRNWGRPLSREERRGTS